MQRFLIALLTLGLITCAAFGDAKIPVKDRVHNTPWPTGYCAWAAIETVCRHQGVKAGYDLVEKRKLDPNYVYPDGTVLARNFGADAPIIAKLKELGIKYEMNPTDKTNKAGIDLIKKTVRSGYGAVVAVKCGLPTTPEAHALTVVDMNDKTVEYIDSNDPERIYVGSMKWFEEQWNGFVLVVEK